MQSVQISTSWGPSRASSLTLSRRRQVLASPSPPRRGRCHDDGRRGVVQYPILTRSNYERVDLVDVRQPTGARVIVLRDRNCEEDAAGRPRASRDFN